MTESVRLAKRVVELNSCSRREAELYIIGGGVSVDGQVVELPQFMVSPGQRVELRPGAKPVALAPVTIIFHQEPAALLSEKELRQLICAESHWPADHSKISFLNQHIVNIAQCLPLDAQASGLAIWTQDGRVLHKLKEDAAILEQEYVVEVAGELAEDGLKLLNHGLSFNGKALPAIKVSWQNETRLRFAVKAMQAGQLEYMCQAVGLQVVSMKRLRVGRLSMAKLPLGQWRYLLPYERF